MGTASLALGIISVVLSFIPIINNIAFFLAILAIIFGLISLKKNKNKKGKAIAALILSVLAIIITLFMQDTASKAIDKTNKELDKTLGNSTEEVLKDDLDAQLGQFQVTTSEYGLNSTKLVVTLKNKTDKKHSYSLHIEAVDSNGKRIDDDYVYANDLAAGQSQDFETFTYVEDEKLDAMKTATFKIVEATVS